ncbi:class I SAM-dependent methyltransferase [Bradyrhizobium sp. CSS354]|uniref:class I SAM-dependent methyltransferase n=1 Tax=unclassified Bradyrhizobium TaxID=2631580 RepID=UPI0023B18C5C|nr:class I SAM-dependent methyltransferase [Bradyrhizobium sp. CSS354]MDE5461759.1 methyltransferase domain-containing protein [Bradyrhizobium sp. CSS354]
MPHASHHDIPTGKLTRCQVCGSERLELVIDLGHQPLCDSLPSKAQLDGPETSYPLRQVWCRDCSLSQIDYVVPPEVVFHPEYPYRSGITKELAVYQDAFVQDAVTDLGLKPDELVVDIGSNDGTLLSGFKRRGMRVLGIEPTNIGRIAQEQGIETLQAFFDEETARKVVETHGHAKVATATNVFAHVAQLGGFIRGLERLLAPDGVFILENHYLLDVIEGGQFDTIYHEHLRTYSLKSIVKLFEFFDFTCVDAQRVSRYGGNIRVYVAKGRGRPVKPALARLLKAEDDFGLSNPECYAAFRARAEKVKRDLLELALDCNKKGLSFVGNSCPGRCSTLLNYVGIDRTLMPYICEQPTSLKLGLHLPGKQIPIVDNERLIREQPDYVVLLAWHYGQPIAEQLRARGLKSKLVMPLPEVSILPD